MKVKGARSNPCSSPQVFILEFHLPTTPGSAEYRVLALGRQIANVTINSTTSKVNKKPNSVKELHAHINGSVSESTIEKLVAKKQKLDHQFSFKKGSTATLKECFEKFRLIHQLTDNVDAVYQVTYDVIHEFCDDNVRYLELRSTPREVTETGMTKELYVDAVLRAIRDCEAENLDIEVKLLLAIDRRNGVQVGQDTVKLAQKFRESHPDLVVGIDLSGDPSVGDGRDFIPVFKEAKDFGLKLALHLCEVPALQETMDLLCLPPDRIGHGTCLHPGAGGTQEFVDTVLTHKTPLGTVKY
uniref:Adenosine deaminase-like protein n=1 Tax=Magallana gigas TaxID=29159 RepID=K1QQ56_MAGGI